MSKTDKFLVLGIETSCDETAASVVASGKEILSNVLYSQIETHREFGGVFPELSSRRHLQKMIPIIEEALEVAQVTLNEIDLIAVSGEPGLIGALLMGVSAAKALAYALEIPIVSVNHVEAHLYASTMKDEEISFPAIGLVVSGGHTSLVQVDAIGEYREIGKTVDDAIGEAFDKVARMLGLPYPGGPEIERLAKSGDPMKYDFTAGRVKDKPFHFSFSGMKTQVLYTLKGQNAKRDSEWIIPKSEAAHIAASFQRAALDRITKTTLRAARERGIKNILIGGGVSQNQTLREKFELDSGDSISIHFPQEGLSLDNAAMVAGLGYEVFNLTGSSAKLDFTPSPKNKCLSF